MTEILAFDFEHDGVVSYPARAYRTTMDVATFSPLARSTDPRTSAEAAASVTPTAPTLEQLILMAALVPGGMTDDDFASVLPNRHPPTVKTARSRLSRRGLLMDSGRTRPSDRGRAMIVWTQP